jgi:hypothetical protein
MKVCNVVNNSIWHDPIVKKQISSYMDNDVELFCNGIKEPRYVKDEVEKIPIEIIPVDIDEYYYSDKRTPVTKIIHEYNINKFTYSGVSVPKIEIRFSKEESDFLINLKWWNKDISWIKNHAYFFSDIKILMTETSLDLNNNRVSNE